LLVLISDQTAGLQPAVSASLQDPCGLLGKTEFPAWAVLNSGNVKLRAGADPLGLVAPRLHGHPFGARRSQHWASSVRYPARSRWPGTSPGASMWPGAGPIRQMPTRCPPQHRSSARGAGDCHRLPGGTDIARQPLPEHPASSAQRGHQRSQHLTLEPASSPGTPGRYYHPRSHTGDRRYSAGGRELLNSGDDAKRVPRGVGVDPQWLLRVIRAVLEQPGAER
jgi:hypothetical protein